MHFVIFKVATLHLNLTHAELAKVKTQKLNRKKILLFYPDEFSDANNIRHIITNKKLKVRNKNEEFHVNNDFTKIAFLKLIKASRVKTK